MQRVPRTERRPQSAIAAKSPIRERMKAPRLAMISNITKQNLQRVPRSVGMPTTPARAVTTQRMWRSKRSAMIGLTNGRRTVLRIGMNAAAATRSATRQTIAAARQRVLTPLNAKFAAWNMENSRSTFMSRMRRNSILSLRQRVPQRQPTTRAALSAAKPGMRALSTASLLAMHTASLNGRGKVIRLQRQRLLVPAAAVTSKLQQHPAARSRTS